MGRRTQPSYPRRTAFFPRSRRANGLQVLARGRSGALSSSALPALLPVLNHRQRRAALAHGRAAPEPALLAAAVAVSTAAVLLLLVPKINALRDRQLAGDDAAGRAFDRAHRLSVGINFVQIGALILAVAR